MKTVDEIYQLVVDLNEEAHQLAWDSWEAADELEDSDNEDDWERAEDLREDASAEQSMHFRDLYWELEPADQEAIKHWLNKDEQFAEEFATWFGQEEFSNEFDISEGGTHD